MKLAYIFLSITPLWGACVSVGTDRILAKDLAAARSEFAELDPAVEIGFAPLPGVTRVLQPAELTSLARKYGVSAEGHFESVCFVRSAAASAEGVAAAPAKPVVLQPDVLRGEQVSVEVTSGAALLRFQADAESSGRRGDNVLVRNPENGKLFQARVDGKGKVTVQR